MTHYIYKRIQSDLSFTDLRMAVFVAAQTIHAVIQMNCFQSGKSDHLIKFMKHTIQVMDNIISSIPHVTGIQTDAQFIILLHPVNNLSQFLKC